MGILPAIEIILGNHVEWSDFGASPTEQYGHIFLIFISLWQIPNSYNSIKAPQSSIDYVFKAYLSKQSTKL